MNEIIVTERLTKKYRDIEAVSEISLNVRKGEIYGFLGLNGAGKTTTIRMLLGMVKPNSGKAFINGCQINNEKQEIWSNLGYLVEIPYSYPHLTVLENLEITRQMRFLKDKSTIADIIQKLKLEPYANRKAKELSLGNVQRLGLAKALIHRPAILILDEPTNGLDPAGIYEIRELLTDMAVNHGVTIFISSHILGEISKLATRIGIIHEGKLLQEVNTETLENLCEKTLQINSGNQKKTKALLAHNNYLFNLSENGLLESTNPEVVKNPGNIATILVNGGCPPTMLLVKEEDLESYFLRTIKSNGGVL